MIWILLRVSSRQSLNVWWWGLPVRGGASCVIMSVCMRMCFRTCWAFRVSTLSMLLFYYVLFFSFVFLSLTTFSLSSFSVSFSMPPPPTSSFILSLTFFSPLCHVISVTVCLTHFFLHASATHSFFLLHDTGFHTLVLLSGTLFLFLFTPSLTLSILHYSLTKSLSSLQLLL